MDVIIRTYRDPRPDEVYNLGGGRGGSRSILEAFDRFEPLTGRRMTYDERERAREGDPLCSISDLAKMRAHFPDRSITRSLDDIFEEIVRAWADPRNAPAAEGQRDGT